MTLSSDIRDAIYGVLSDEGLACAGAAADEAVRTLDADIEQWEEHIEEQDGSNRTRHFNA
jgi:hypothetical protein